MNEEPIERILALHTLVLGKEESEKQRVASELGIDYDEYKKRIVGKQKEAEFLVILRALNVLNHLVAYEEGFSTITNEFTCDYEVELIDGYKMLIEVKHTDKDEYKIAGGNLNNRIDFAKNRNLPLRFAISIKGYWGLFTAEYLQSKNGKITLSDFVNDNEINNTWDHEFGTFSYIFPANIKIKSVYSHNHPKGTGFESNAYGELISYELWYKDRRILRVKGKESKEKSLMMLTEALQDRLSICNHQVIIKDDLTVAIDKSSTSQVIHEYRFLLSIIEHTKIDDIHSQSDNVSIISTTPGFQFPTCEYIRIALSILVEKGLDITVRKGNKQYSFKQFQELLLTKNTDKE